MRRPSTEAERVLVSRMCAGLQDAERAQVLADLADAIVEPLNDDGSIVRFELLNYTRLPGIGRRVAVDGVANDRDGAHLNVILFTDENNRLYELEIVRFDEGSVIGPDWATLKIY